MIDREKLVERFIRYAKIYTTSDEESTSYPSSKRQFDLLNLLVTELKELGLKDAGIDKYGYVYGSIPSNINKDVSKVGFMAHVDTSPAESGENVKPIIHKNYPGGDIVLPGDPSVIISPKGTPVLNDLIGNDLITSDGTTLLGADDKAGIAEIMTAVDYIMSNPDFKHGEVKVAFTPDEEIGKGVEFFDVKRFGADFAFTMDGGPLGELEDESFCADSAEVICKGINVHPGYAKDKMVNSVRMASLFVTLMNEKTLPETTEKRESYYHAVNIAGMENETKINIIVRSFDEDGLKVKEDDLEKIKVEVLKKFPKGEIEIKIKEQYRNMKIEIDKNPEIMKIAEKAFEMSNVPTNRKAIRGGTDGARLTFMGIPTPNIFAGGVDFHSKKEFISINTMEKSVEVVLNIVRLMGS